VKNNQDSQTQNMTSCNICFFGVQWGLGGAKPPEAGEFSRIFDVTVIFTYFVIFCT